MLQDPELHMVILDELNIVLRKDYLPLAEVIEGCAPGGPTCTSWSPAATPSPS